MISIPIAFWLAKSREGQATPDEQFVYILGPR